MIEGGAGTVTNFGTISSFEAGVLESNGNVTNGLGSDRTASISGNYWGVYEDGTSTVTNSGSISGGSREGIFFRAGGGVINNATGQISGALDGIYAKYDAATVTNAGHITGTSGAGVSLTAGGLVTNEAGGVIIGATGVGATRVAATIVNSGSIGGTTANASVYLGAGGSVTNSTGGIIGGQARNGISLLGFGSIANAGTISGSVGAFLAAGGDVTNSVHGLIIGGTDGVLVNNGNVTVTNSGTISGANYSVKFNLGGSDTLIVDPGAVFLGIVNGSSATSTLVLASAASTGTIFGLGTEFAGFQAVTETVGANWTVTGSNSLASTTALTVMGTLTDAGNLTVAGAAAVNGTLATAGIGKVQLGQGLTLAAGSTLITSTKGSIEIGAAGSAAKHVVTVDKGSLLSGAGTIEQAIVDQGTLNANGGTLALASSITGLGSVSISSNSVLSVGGRLGASGLDFLGGNATAVFGAPTRVTSTIAGFKATDTLDLVNFVATKLSFAGHTLTVHGSGGSIAHLTFAASYVTKDFAFGTDHHGGTNITFV